MGGTRPGGGLSVPARTDNIIALAGCINPDLANYIRSTQQVAAVASRYGSYVLPTTGVAQNW